MIWGYHYFRKHPICQYHPTLHGFFLAAFFGRFALHELSQRYFGCLIPSQGHELIVDLSWLVVFFPSEEYYTVKMGSSSPNRGRFIKKYLSCHHLVRIFDLKKICAKCKKSAEKPKALGDMGVSKNRGTPKWMVYDGKRYEHRWFGGTTIFGNTQYVNITQPFMDFFSLLFLDVSPSMSWAKGTSAVLFQAKDTNS